MHHKMAHMRVWTCGSDWNMARANLSTEFAANAYVPLAFARALRIASHCAPFAEFSESESL